MQQPTDSKAISPEGGGLSPASVLTQFDLEAFKAFVASKPEDEAYPTLHGGQCVLAQFGFPFVSGFNIGERGIPEAVYEAAVYEGRPTFGALAERLNELGEVQP